MAKMRELSVKILQDRIDSPKPDATDLLNLMLEGVDRETGEKLDIENVRFQIPTFLSAGYETTSSSLTFLYYFLCSNPDVLAKAQQEVDEVVGDKVITPEMLPKLHYLEACMRESLRIQPPNNLINKVALRDTVLGGKYLVRKGQVISGVQRHFHRDKSVWGEDSDVYRPERMLKDGCVVLPPNAWKPVGLYCTIQCYRIVYLSLVC
jgi:cytochrome P450/NADPH-cytochrome P450 reductase